MKTLNRFWWIILATTILTALFFILIKAYAGVSGYPLDDAWIHQTYARNLAATGQFAFNPGEQTAGSTSPLWTFLLSIGYMLGLPHELWATLLGMTGLFSCGVVVYDWLKSEIIAPSKWLLAGSLLVVTEWHLVWASVSGMETILQAALFAWVILECLRSDPRWTWMGVGIGLSIWIRPDGITLLGPAIAVFLSSSLITQNKEKYSIRCALASLMIVIFFFSGFLLFNYLLSHSIWPNTLYAKQFEYRELLAYPILNRYVSLWTTLLTGGNIILFPGFLWGLWKGIKDKNWALLAAYSWCIGYILIYALRLPVSYQHGRYLMPLIPVYIALSVIGYSFVQIRSFQSRYVVISSFRGVAILLNLGFVLLGARAYRIDVAAVDDLMVQPALWVKNNTQPNDLIAAHDIGALGYFGNRRILDLAGLINPEVIPIVRDFPKIFAYTKEKNAKYLIIFPDWYGTSSATKGELVYHSNTPEEILQGHSNMEIYRLPK